MRSSLLSLLICILLGKQQCLEQFFECGVCAFFHFLLFHGSDRMLHDQNWRIGSAERFALRLGEGFKRMRDNGDRKPAAFLKFDGIVDTPRCARPSISQSADDKVRLSGKLVQVDFRRALLRSKFSSPDHACDITVLSQKLLESRLQ